MSELVPMKPQVYKDPRPAEYFDPFYKRAREHRPGVVYEIVRLFSSLLMWTVFRARSISAQNVPGSGPVIIAPNHFSYADHFFVACFLRRRLHFMGKSQMFTGFLAHVYSRGGVFPVRRGHRDNEVFRTAHAVLARGGCLTMYCEGGRSRTGKLAEQARPGIGRIALESGAPVVPTAIYGSSRVRNYKRGEFPKVWVRYGKPIRWEPVDDPTREQQQEVADQIFAEIRALYEEIEQLGPREVARRERRARRST